MDCPMQIPPAKPQKYSRGRIWAATARSPCFPGRRHVRRDPAGRRPDGEPSAAGTVSPSSLHPNSSSDPLQAPKPRKVPHRSEEHTSELQSLMRISYAVFCLKKKNTKTQNHTCKINSNTN